MRVVIVHYHLNPGGVTTVIQAASQGLAATGIGHVVLSGSPARTPGTAALPVRQVEGLGYLINPGDLTAAALLERMRAAANDALGGQPDLWHFHNHSLGKNRLIADVVSLLAESGARLLLQIHDLAENGRPANYPLIADCSGLYPFSPRIHYAFLNRRDLAIFRDAGLPEESSHLLQNPISPAPPSEPLTPDRPAVVFAPIRGIRRKNLGELVFLSALAPRGTAFAVSRAPENPDALPIHDTWRKFSRSHGFPIEFDVADRFTPAAGASADFQSWVRHATHFVTASVCEGFGLPFLEAVAHGKPLFGRNLPHLTEHGLRCGDLYDRLLVPLDWIDVPLLRDHLTTDLERNHRLYQRPIHHREIDSIFDTLAEGDVLDFGNLSEPFQQTVIERLVEPGHRRVPLVEIDGVTEVLEDWLARVIANRAPSASPEELAPWSLEIYQEKLTSIYSRIGRASPAPVRQLSSAAILSAHLGSFHFLMSALKPKQPSKAAFRAVIFDIYGTLLIAPAGGVRHDPDADPMLRKLLADLGHQPPESPSGALAAAVARHHAAAGFDFPEVDLRDLWREILQPPEETDMTELVIAIEQAWHPATLMPGAEKLIQRLARSGISLGLLSNAQCNTLPSLGGLADLFPPELTILSYQQGVAKPSADLFQLLADRLDGRGIPPAETLYVGNDPAHDILPAAAAGFRTALFIGHPASLRRDACSPDFTIAKWSNFPV